MWISTPSSADPKRALKPSKAGLSGRAQARQIVWIAAI
jgi:hypothetical protein